MLRTGTADGLVGETLSEVYLVTNWFTELRERKSSASPKSWSGKMSGRA
jgi:hypothetical protein